ncbi:MAG: hypothetical protein ACP5RH_21570 [Leptodesmis sp.]|uniref:hypothetical protein n=1 Tax=Leptodesmis sp. TaxID=3100501 RepID=UPI003D0FFE17
MIFVMGLATACCFIYMIAVVVGDREHIGTSLQGMNADWLALLVGYEYADQQR